MSYELDEALAEVQRLRELLASERAEFQKRLDDASAEADRLRNQPERVETKTVFKNVPVTTVMPPKLVHIERRVEVPVVVEKVVEKVVEVPVTIDKIVEKIVRVPVTIEKMVEKVVRVPVTVEKIVEKINPVTKTEYLPCEKCGELSEKYGKLKKKFAELVEKTNGGN